MFDGVRSHIPTPDGIKYESENVTVNPSARALIKSTSCRLSALFLRLL